MTVFSRFIALGDSMTEGMCDEIVDGNYRGWADRVADSLSKANPNFSPLKYAVDNNSWGDIVTKIKSDRYLSAGDIVDGVLCPGSFGSFGWCITLKLST